MGDSPLLWRVSFHLVCTQQCPHRFLFHALNFCSAVTAWRATPEPTRDALGLGFCLCLLVPCVVHDGLGLVGGKLAGLLHGSKFLFVLLRLFGFLRLPLGQRLPHPLLGQSGLLGVVLCFRGLLDSTARITEVAAGRMLAPPPCSFPMASRKSTRIHCRRGSTKISAAPPRGPGVFLIPVSPFSSFGCGPRALVCFRWTVSLGRRRLHGPVTFPGRT